MIQKHTFFGLVRKPLPCAQNPTLRPWESAGADAMLAYGRLMLSVRGRGQWRRVRWFGMCCAMTACSAYDAALLKAPALRTGGGGSPAIHTGGVGGSGGSVVVGDGGISTGTPDATTNETRCGDGQVTGEEKCDTGIEIGKPGACAIDCAPLGACSLRALNGSGCQAECVLLQANCNGGDGCCPGTCTRANDSDCSITCGDGVVQTDSGETCEDRKSTRLNSSHRL